MSVGNFLINLFRAMEVRGVGGGDLGSNTVVVNSDGELQYELNQQTNSFLTNTHLVQQGGSWDDASIAISHTPLAPSP